jgi:hypothetical protein
VSFDGSPWAGRTGNGGNTGVLRALCFLVLHEIAGTNGHGFRRFVSGVCRFVATSVEGRCTPLRNVRPRKRMPRLRSSRRPHTRYTPPGRSFRACRSGGCDDPRNSVMNRLFSGGTMLEAQSGKLPLHDRFGRAFPAMVSSATSVAKALPLVVIGVYPRSSAVPGTWRVTRAPMICPHGHTTNSSSQWPPCLSGEHRPCPAISRLARLPLWQSLGGVAPGFDVVCESPVVSPCAAWGWRRSCRDSERALRWHGVCCG